MAMLLNRKEIQIVKDFAMKSSRPYRLSKALEPVVDYSRRAYERRPTVEL